MDMPLALLNVFQRVQLLILGEVLTVGSDRFQSWPAGGINRAMVHLGWACACCEPIRYQAEGRSVTQISKNILQRHIKSMGAEL